MRSRHRPALGDRYAILLEIGRTLAATLKPEQLYRALWRETRRLIEAPAFFVACYERESDSLTLVFRAERNEVAPPQLQVPGAESRAVRERRPVLQNAGDVERWLVGLGERGDEMQSGISAPVMRGDRVLGLIGLRSPQPNVYGPDELQLLAAIADIAAVALENALYVEQLERRRREAERIEEIGRAITGSLELPKVLDRVARAAVDLLQADGATVWLVHDDATVEVAMTAGRGLFPQGLVFQADPGSIAAIRRQPRRVFTNVDDSPLSPPNYRGLSRTGSSVAVLLTAEDTLIGALSVRHGTPRRYAEEEIRLLGRIADQAAIAVTNARMHERLLALSLTDPLTQLPNRRHLEMFLEKEIAAARRGRRLAVVLYDLDNFKGYNDSAGHQAGDLALRAFADILAHNTRAMNLAARYGGDEFMSVLTDTDRRGAAAHVTRVVRLVEAHPLLGPAAIRASAGIAIFNDRIDSADALLRAADRDLYRRKAARRSPAPR